jgi:aminoglycoside phosphotransferase (APT) family kinase protein
MHHPTKNATRMEAAILRALDARRERMARATTPFVPPPREEVGERLRRLLAVEIGDDFRIADLRPLTGGASKMHYLFELERRGAKGESDRRTLVLRCAFGESLGTAPNFQREADVQRALRDLVPVPEVLAVDPEGTRFGAPAIVLGHCPGTTVPPESAGKPSGFGSAFSRARRASLGPAFVDTLARIHAAADALAFSSVFERPKEGTTEATDWLLAWWRRVWEDDALEDHPMIDVAFDWLAENAPTTERIALVHGDYRAGNFLFDPETNRITAMLDWEMARLGDRHEDLGWALARIYTAKDEDGRDLVCGLAPRDEFLERYEEASGLPVDRERLFFYEVLNELKIAVIALGTGPRNAHASRSQVHLTNVVFVGAGYRCVARLHELLAPRIG